MANLWRTFSALSTQSGMCPRHPRNQKTNWPVHQPPDLLVSGACIPTSQLVFTHAKGHGILNISWPVHMRLPASWSSGFWRVSWPLHVLDHQKSEDQVVFRFPAHTKIIWPAHICAPETRRATGNSVRDRREGSARHLWHVYHSFVITVRIFTHKSYQMQELVIKFAKGEQCPYPSQHDVVVALDHYYLFT